MVSRALSAPVSGVGGLLVLTMSTEPSAFFTSQVQPEPKLPTALLVKASLKAAKLPHLALMAAASAPVGSPPPAGFMLFQKKVWFHTWAALLKIGPDDFLTTSSSARPANSVPPTRLFRLVT